MPSAQSRAAPSAAFLAAALKAGQPSEHPYGGISFVRLGKPVCFASLTAVDAQTVEISGMYAPVRGGGRHAMSLLVLLADLHDVTLFLVATSILTSRMDTPKVADWYEKFGFVRRKVDRHGRIPMLRFPSPLFSGPGAS